MAQAFKVTAKQNIAGGGKIIAKGMSVQCTANGSPSVNTILEAFKQQLGIEIKGISVTTSYFNIEKLK